jgi:hypothetical protein
MAKKSGRHKSVYLPEELAKKLEGRSDINFSRVCRAALEQACSSDEERETSEAAALASLSKAEEELRTIRSAMEGIARRAARQAGMVVLTGDEAETYNSILETGINSFILKTKKEGVEEYKEEIQKKKRATIKKTQSKAARLARHKDADETSDPEVVQRTHELTEEVMADPSSNCVDCGDAADVHCKNCGKPLCWSCWTGDSPDEGLTAVQLCSNCLGA